MLAKLIAHARRAPRRVAGSRPRWTARSAWALPTNRALPRRACCATRVSPAARCTTAFLGEHFATDESRAERLPSGLSALAAACIALLPRTPLPALWARLDALRRGAGRRCRLAAGGTRQTWQLGGTPGELLAQLRRGAHRIGGLQLDAATASRATLDGRPLRALRIVDGTRCGCRSKGGSSRCRTVATARRPPAPALRTKRWSRRCTGASCRCWSPAGSSCVPATLLLVLEAMKMEHRILAPHDGTIDAVHARVGDQVAVRRLLVEVTRT